MDERPKQQMTSMGDVWEGRHRIPASRARAGLLGEHEEGHGGLREQDE